MSEEKESIEDLLKELNVIPDEEKDAPSKEKVSAEMTSEEETSKEALSKSKREKQTSEKDETTSKKEREDETPKKKERNVILNEKKESDTGGVEKVMTLLGGVALLAALGLSALLFFFPILKEPNWIKNEYSHIEFPTTTGTSLIIDKVKSHWDVKEKKKADFPEVEFTPVSEIFINRKSGSGVMRAFFVNGKGKYMGDALTASFKDGKFGDEKSIIFLGTEGYEHESDFHAYDSGFGDPWHLEILEGESEKTPASEYKTILRMPLYYNRKPIEKETSSS